MRSRMEWAKKDKSEGVEDDSFEEIFPTYELFVSTILRFTGRSTDRRDCCIGDSGRHHI